MLPPSGAPAELALPPCSRQAVYRGYTDATFTKRAPAPPSAGLLGATLAAEVGQHLEVVFKNALGFPVNLTPDGGLELLGITEGAPAAGTAANGGGKGLEAGAAVEPGQTVTYKYRVPERCGQAARAKGAGAAAASAQQHRVGRASQGTAHRAPSAHRPATTCCPPAALQRWSCER